MSEGTADFKSKEEANQSPLALKLFEVDGVKGVFFGTDFITVSKEVAIEWAVLKPLILGVMIDHFMTHQPLFYGEGIPISLKNEEDPLVIQIQEILDTRVRPAVAMDGGDIVFDHFAEGIVYVRMQGSCSGCPSSSATLKTGIENMLRHYVPEVLEVRAVES